MREGEGRVREGDEGKGRNVGGRWKEGEGRGDGGCSPAVDGPGPACYLQLLIPSSEVPVVSTL